jgi:flagellin-like protein
MGVRGRKGMSPLIATVLLMAFAVALGGMIMNWGASRPVLDCTSVSLDIIQFCHDDTAVNIHARNTGDQIIAGLAFKIDSPGSTPISVALQDSELRKGQTLTSRIPFLIGDNTSVSLIASLSNNGQQPELCPKPYKTENPLPKC